LRLAACRLPGRAGREERHRVVAMRDGSEQFGPERIDARLAFRLLPRKQPLRAVLSHPEEEDGGDDGEAGGEDEASDGHRGLHGLPKAAVEWSADRGCSKFGS